jgi:D-threonate/D-erythronate kinase
MDRFRRVTRLRLLADDLTGALDSAARFVPLSGVVPTCWKLPADLPQSLAMDSGTRERDAADVLATIASVAPLLDDGDPAFKKIDSLLRGHVALELAACARRFDHCIVAPAFPFQGRITRNGRQLVRTGTGWRDTGVDLSAAGVRVCDAETDADLDAIVAAGRLLKGRVLWCGTGGLAAALAGRVAVPRPRLPRPILALIGSDHPVSAAQLATVAERHHRLPRADVPAIARSLGAGAAAVSVVPPPGAPREAACGDIVRRFAGLLAAIGRPGTLFVTGGETLRNLCDPLGLLRLDVDGEIAPGVPTSIMRGGTWDGQRLVSKSGAFGDARFFARLFGDDCVRVVA